MKRAEEMRPMRVAWHLQDSHWSTAPVGLPAAARADRQARSKTSSPAFACAGSRRCRWWRTVMMTPCRGAAYTSSPPSQRSRTTSRHRRCRTASQDNAAADWRTNYHKSTRPCIRSPTRKSRQTRPRRSRQESCGWAKRGKAPPPCVAWSSQTSSRARFSGILPVEARLHANIFNSRARRRLAVSPRRHDDTSVGQRVVCVLSSAKSS